MCVKIRWLFFLNDFWDAFFVGYSDSGHWWDAVLLLFDGSADGIRGDFSSFLLGDLYGRLFFNILW
jgi:hypothetical protein